MQAPGVVLFVALRTENTGDSATKTCNITTVDQGVPRTPSALHSVLIERKYME